MKKKIFIFLISYAFSIHFLEKDDSFITIEENGIFYLDATKFDKNDNIAIQFNALESSVKLSILYQFSDIQPTYYFQPSTQKKADKKWATYKDDNNKTSNYTLKGRFDIKKTVSKKYLIIKYMGFQKYKDYGYLKIENISKKSNKSYTIVIIILFIVFFILLGLFIFYEYYTRKKLRENNQPIKETLTSKTLYDYSKKNKYYDESNKAFDSDYPLYSSNHN